MHHADLDSFIRSGALARGPVALILAEDEVELASTLRHAVNLRFGVVAALMPPSMALPADVAAEVTRVDHDTLADGALVRAVNACVTAAPGTWFHYCFNAEYLFFPFCETRTVGDLVTFVAEERRDTVLTYVVDLYAADLDRFPSAVSVEDARLDRSGYYALARKDAWNIPLERQLDVFGGLRWRFEEHVPKSRRRIDRVSLFRALPGLELRPDFTVSIPELNTYASPWHNSPTAAVCSFRTAKALKRNPGSSFDIDSFRWHNSAPFTWRSGQLLELGLMEPGQWF